jgi:hypothetical protein
MMHHVINLLSVFLGSQSRGLGPIPHTADRPAPASHIPDGAIDKPGIDGWVRVFPSLKLQRQTVFCAMKRLDARCAGLGMLNIYERRLAGGCGFNMRCHSAPVRGMYVKSISSLEYYAKNNQKLSPLTQGIYNATLYSLSRYSRVLSSCKPFTVKSQPKILLSSCKPRSTPNLDPPNHKRHHDRRERQRQKRNHGPGPLIPEPLIHNCRK